MTGKSVSLIEQGSVISPNPGDSFIKGGAANSMMVVDINKRNLNQIKNSNWLINDASITFNVDKDKMNAANPDGSKANEPLRVYLYDLNNKKQLVDYTIDQSSYSTFTKFNKYVFGGILKKDSDGRGLSYKIRLTNQIRNLIQSDTVTNVRLGLVVTETINDVATYGNKRLKTPAVISTNPNSSAFNTIKTIPAMSVVHPLGTVLFGSDAPEAKKPKLQIYYTQLKQN